MTGSLLWTSFATIAGVWLVTVVSPGPNFLATAHTALAASRRDGLLVAFGISIGTTIWASASLAGLGLLFQTAGWLYHLVKLAGACYLVYVGLRMVLGRATSAGSARAARVTRGVRALRHGLFTDLGNPKAAAFFTSLFAVAVPLEAPPWFRLVIVATVVGIAGAWYALTAVAVASGPVARLYRRFEGWTSRLAGALFVALGVRLGLSER
jgi:threonine efflux protein